MGKPENRRRKSLQNEKKKKEKKTGKFPGSGPLS